MGSRVVLIFDYSGHSHRIVGIYRLWLEPALGSTQVISPVQFDHCRCDSCFNSGRVR